MKRLLILTLCLILAFAFTACGTGSGSQSSGSDQSGSGSGDTPSSASDGDLFAFSAETFAGEPFTSDDVKDAKLVMVNLWEPWCGPCVGEMPYLEKLYEEYKDEGFVILGVYTDFTMEEDVADLLEEDGITYPILHASNEFAGFQTGYVPTTVFLTGEGKLLSPEPVIGAQSYETWKAAVSGLLEELDG